MAVLNPNHLLDQAARLTARDGRGAPRQADLRRAISSAYYGLFHAIVTQAIDDFFGPTQRHTPQYEKMYRSIKHEKLRKICDEIVKSNFPKNHSIFGHDLTGVASAFISLQEKRHLADYAPRFKVGLSDATLMVTSARTALDSFRGVTETRRRIFSALIIFQIR